MKRKLPQLFAAAAAAALLLTACGGSSSASQATSSTAAVSYGMDTATEAAFDDQAAFFESGAVPGASALALENDAGAVDSVLLDSRKIVRYSDLSLETLSFDEAFAQISQLIKAQGGYVENQNVNSSGNSYQRSGEFVQERSAYIQARIPSENLDQTIAEISNLCNVISQSESAEDISDQYFDSEARLATLRLQEERLLEILSKAEKLEDVVTLEQALSEVRYEIERLTASLRRMDNRVTYSYLNIDLREVVKYNEAVAAPKTFGEKFSASLRRGGERLVDVTQGVILFAAESGPLLLFWMVVFGLIVFGAVKLSRLAQKRRTSRTAPPPLFPSKPEKNSSEKSESPD